MPSKLGFHFLHLVCFIVFIIAQAVAADARLAPELAEQAKLRSTKDGAETLYSINIAELKNDGKWSRQSYYSVRINDQEAARDYGRIAIPYNHYYADMQLQFANVMSAEGEIKTVADDAVQLRVVGGGQDFYNDRSEIVFSLPDVAPGSIIEFQFQNTTTRRAIDTVHSDSISPYWFQSRVANDGWRADGVRHFYYTLIAPKETTFLTEVYGKLNAKPKITEQENQRIKAWHWQGVPAAALESSMLPSHQVLPGIHLSTSTHWALVDAWSWKKIADKLQRTPALSKALERIKLRKNATRDQKIRAVYRYMQDNMRYVFAHLGRGGYEPHSPDDIIRNGYGDCKDQTVLAVALLRQLGVDAYPVLVETPNAGTSKTTLVRLIFDHMLVWVAPDTENPALWMDTTSDRGLYPGLSNYLDGQPAFIVNGKGGQLTHVDADFPPNIASLELDYRQNKKNQTVVDMVYRGSGIFEQHLRQWWKHDNSRDTSLQQFLGGVFDNNGQYQLSSNVINSEDLFAPVRVEAHFVFTEPTDVDKSPAYGTSFGQIYSLAGEAHSLQVPDTRKTTWYAPLATELRITSRMSGGVDRLPAVLSNSSSVSNAYFDLEQTGTRRENDYVIDIRYRRASLTLDVDAYGEFYRALLDLGSLGSWVVSMVDDASAVAATALKTVKKERGEGGVEYQMALARQYLDKGEFSEALIPAQEAVRISPKNGEAWYVLGSAQGFNALIDESNASFDQAKNLGYAP